MIADGLTKSLVPIVFKRFVKFLSFVIKIEAEKRVEQNKVLQGHQSR